MNYERESLSTIDLPIPDSISLARFVYGLWCTQFEYTRQNHVQTHSHPHQLQHLPILRDLLGDKDLQTARHCATGPGRVTVPGYRAVPRLQRVRRGLSVWGD
jgi:hypothetical protein